MPGKKTSGSQDVAIGAKKAVRRRKMMKPYQTRTMLEKERLYQVIIPTKRKQGKVIGG